MVICSLIRKYLWIIIKFFKGVSHQTSTKIIVKFMLKLSYLWYLNVVITSDSGPKIWKWVPRDHDMDMGNCSKLGQLVAIILGCGMCANGNWIWESLMLHNVYNLNRGLHTHSCYWCLLDTFMLFSLSFICSSLPLRTATNLLLSIVFSFSNKASLSLSQRQSHLHIKRE